ncbi:MAG TPA: acyltransferase, partial [Micromonosporaceae bacterium]|nr:acyltransferase [Micromonosporaceae bacterium]
MSTPHRHRLPSLTGLRFGAAMLVFGVHAYAFLPLADPLDQRLARLLLDAGDLGVSFFFVLSGFVLTWSSTSAARSGGGRTVWRFWRDRLARIYPAHLAALVIVIGCLAVSGRIAKVNPETLVTGALLIQAWYPEETIHLGVNAVTWSLSCEVAFYLCFPALYAGLRRLTGRGPAALYAGVVACCAAVWAVPYLAGAAVPDEHRRWFVYVFPLTRMIEFVLGIVLALLVRSGDWRGPGLPLATGAFVVNYLLVPWLPQAGRDTAAVIAAIALLVPAAAVADLRGSRSPWRHPFLVWLGERSYSFYLVHLAVVVAAVTLADRAGRWPLPYAAGMAVGLLALAYGIAAILYAYVEMPALRRLTGGTRVGAPRSWTPVP